ncbi:MAG TPA: serine/threonine-protein kinase [Candidatus Peribacterales bacterium]|nr:serine/threonine-protein kinase [Candidatus Peribacterales bacterium]
MDKPNEASVGAAGGEENGGVAESLSPDFVVQELIRLGVLQVGDQARVLDVFARQSMMGDIRVRVVTVLADEFGLDVKDNNDLLPFLRGEEGFSSLVAKLMTQNRSESETLPDIPGFRFIKKLGQGGQGTVWLAQEVEGMMDRKVAIKIFKGTTNKAHLARMIQEVNTPGRLPKKIAHKIVMTHYAKELPGGNGYYAVMEYVEEEECLRDVESGKKPPLTPERVWEIARDLLETLRVFEDAKVAHRDIKPANILVGHDTIKLADFGLVKTDEHYVTFETEAGTFLGTMGYLDPGQAKDTRCDLYALAMTVRTLLTGARPFSDEVNPAKLFNAQLSFSQKVNEYSQIPQGARNKSIATTSPEWVSVLKEPRTECERALAYLTERGSLSADKRPLPSVLIAELCEKFPELMVDKNARKLMDSMRQRTKAFNRKIVMGIGAVVAAIGGVVGVMNWSGSNGNTNENGGNKITEVQGNGSNGNGGKNNGTKENPVLPKKKFAEMTQEEKIAYIDSIAQNAVGSPVPVDENTIELLGTTLKIDWETMPQAKGKNVHAGVFHFTEEHEKKIAAYFQARGVPIVGSPIVNNAPPTRFGLMYRFFEGDGEEKGMICLLPWVGAGMHFSPGSLSEEGSLLFYPCPNLNQELVEKQHFVGVHNPKLRELLLSNLMPTRELFVMPADVDSHFKGASDTEDGLYWFMNTNYVAYKRYAETEERSKPNRE